MCCSWVGEYPPAQAAATASSSGSGLPLAAPVPYWIIVLPRPRFPEGLIVFVGNADVNPGVAAASISSAPIVTVPVQFS